VRGHHGLWRIRRGARSVFRRLNLVAV
jgi:hypothetical protein